MAGWSIEPPVIRFRDIANQAGIRFVLNDGATGKKHQIEPMAGGVAVFDYNSDGRPDIFFVGAAGGHALYRNDRDLKFSDVTADSGIHRAGFATGVAAADFDNDGHTDLFIAGVERNTLLRNLGNGRFADVTARAGFGRDPQKRKPWSIGAGWFDYDNDGHLDLFVVNYCVWIPEKEPPCTIGKSRTYCHPKYYQGLPNQLFHNNGDGTFTDVSAVSGIGAHVGKGMSVSFLDFDRDNRLDVFVANDTVPNFLFRNEGAGKFREVGFEAGVALNADGRAVSSMGVDARDIDNDGFEDLFITANNNETFPLFRGRPKGIFADVTYSSSVGRYTLTRTGWSNAIADLNNDGWKDLFAAAGAIDDNVEEYSHRKSRHPNLMLANLRDGTFADVTVTDLLNPARHRGAALGDFDGDGKLDLVVTRIGEPALLLHNTSEANHWLGLHLVGKRSNRDALGAMVHVTGSDGRQQWSRVTTATGYGSSGDKSVHFGMGDDRVVKSVEIHWPAGTTQKLVDLPVDRVTVVSEP